jgi:endoglucanase
VFRVATRQALFRTLVEDTVHFFQVQRDGADVPRRLDRKPSHLTDRHATVYATPVFEGDGGDVPAAPLEPIGGPVDVEGGWFDAGDFVKFTHAIAYSVAELLLVQRGLHPRSHALAAETRHGLRWLDKVWDQRHKTLYAQVGLGTGSERFGFVGDHDVWRLPEADDALRVRPGDAEYFIKYRPVFRAAPPGAASTATRSTCTTPAPWPMPSWCGRCDAARGFPGSRSARGTWLPTCGGSWSPAPSRHEQSPSARRST